MEKMRAVNVAPPRHRKRIAANRAARKNNIYIYIYMYTYTLYIHTYIYIHIYIYIEI